MRVLLVKMSSMGDVIHTLPALTDAAHAIPGIRFDWVIEPNFAEIPHWHPAVEKTLITPLRHWRRHFDRHAVKKWYDDLQQNTYDYVLDAQGLLKSALITRLAQGFRVGYAWNTAREPLASLIYQRRIAHATPEHAVQKTRILCAKALNYSLPQTKPDYGIKTEGLRAPKDYNKPYVVFLHGTTWATKHWPDSYWQDLIMLCNNSDLDIIIPWGTSLERTRANKFAQSTNVTILPTRLSLTALAGLLYGSLAVVAVDTGLGHLAAALNVPTISIYGPTNSAKTGTLGDNQIHLQAEYACSPCLKKQCPLNSAHPPCFTTVTAQEVWQELHRLLPGLQFSA